MGETPEWQPIETAPKDRKARLIYAPLNKNIYLVCWADGDERDPEGWAVFGTYRHIIREPITHWMPLPTPPNPEPEDIK